MSKRKYIAGSLIALLSVNSLSAINVSAAENIFNFGTSSTLLKQVKIKTATVDTFEELQKAIKDENIEKIVLNSDIEATRDLKIERSVRLDLNGHAIKFLQKGKIIVGGIYYYERNVEKIEPAHWRQKPAQYRTVQEAHYEYKFIPGHYENNTWVSDHTATVWVPKKEEKLPTDYEWVKERRYNVTETERVYKKVDVVIENGVIFGYNGKNASKAFYNLLGKDGDSGCNGIYMLSGDLTLNDLRVYGGNGGNGLNGDAIVGRSGGNGGNGASAVYVSSGNILRANRNCRFVGGDGGKGGNKMSSDWFSFFFTDGSNGKNAVKVGKPWFCDAKIYI